MSGLLCPRELRVRKVRWFCNLPQDMSAQAVFTWCAVQLGIPEPSDSARAAIQDEKCKALNIDPPYFRHFFLLAEVREIQEEQAAM